MDKEEFRIKLEEINHLVELKDYKGAMSVVDSIDWRRVKNVRTLCVVGEIYAANKRYEESKEIFLLAYHRSSIGKTILYRLIEVSLKMGDIEEAMEYYEEYTEVAPNDNMRYILKYKIYKAKKASLEELIQILEEYKEKEFTEKWSYELANLYYQAGEKEKCLDLCNQMVIWFSEGKYVMKALDLKLRLGSLTGEEKERYEQQFVPNLITPGEAKALKESTVQAANKEEKTDVPEKAVPPLEEEAPMIESIRMDEKDINNAESLQEKISKGIRDIFSGKKKEKEEDFEDAEEVQAKEEEVQEEMIKDISSKLDYVDVPELEPEGEDPEEKVPVNVSAEQKPDLSQTIQMPELKIPKSMKNMNRQETEIPKAPIIREDYIQNELPKKNLDDFDFNLEDTILAAATAQGIEIPDGPSSEGEEKDKILTDGYDTEKEETVQEEEVPEDQADETDIEEAAEKEPVTDRAEEPVPELEPEIEDDEEQQEEEQEPESEEEFEETDSIDDWDELEDMDEFEDEDESEARDDFDKDSVPSLEEEDFLSEEDLREAEEEFLNGPAKKTEPVPFKRKHPEGMNTEIFNFQEEIKKVLGDNESLFDDSFSNSGFNDQALSDSVFEEESDDVFIEEEKELKSAIKRVGEEEKLESPEPLTEEEELEQFIESIQPKNGRSPYDIVPRERKLTDDEKKLFSYFVRVPGMKEQLIDALCDVQMAAADKTSRTGNVIVMGGRETGKTRLISSLIPAICKELNLEASKVAYVFADQINGKDMSRIVNKLAGGFLVIENANQLTQETAEQLDKAMEFRTDGLTVIVEDEKIGMRKFIARYPKLAKKFTSMINIPVFTNDELVSFAKVYTKENGYTIDQMGMLALYNMIGMNQKEDEPMNIGAVKNLVDAAIAKSQGGIRKLQRNISKKRTDHDGFIVLYEKDFS